MGNTIPAMHVIANADTWMEDSAIEQLKRTSQLPGMVAVAGMPDLHPGRGYPVGAAFLSKGILYPALVGNDIGCGMSFYQMDLPKAKWSGQKLAQKLGSIDGPLGEAWDETIATFGLTQHPHAKSLGSIGGGNHFAEIQQCDTVYVTAEKLEAVAPWLKPKSLQLLVHSGSRGLGEAIFRAHVDEHNHKGLVAGIESAVQYMTQHDSALAFASANRQLIAGRMLAKLRTEGTLGLNVHHNYVEQVQYDKQTHWLHRKGATPSTQGLVMIPGSRGDYSYLVEPIAGPMSDKSLFSLAHGAGRKWKRSDCLGKLGSRVRFEDLLRTDLGSVVVCNDKALIFEEAPQAYKNVGHVLDSLVEAGLVKTIARFKPVMTYKKQEWCAC
jgi:release factor H-coupled RctB family protein